MNGYNFSDRVRRILQMSREEAARLHHNYVGTEHLLLGLVREGEGIAAAVLTNLDVDLEEMQQRIERTVKKGTAEAAADPDLPYTSRAKKVLEFAMSEARELKHSYVGTEHLLLGLLREEKGIAAQVLTDVGVSLEKVRGETLRLLSTEMPSEPPSSTAQFPERGYLSDLVARIRELVTRMRELVDEVASGAPDGGRAAQIELKALLEKLARLL